MAKGLVGLLLLAGISFFTPSGDAAHVCLSSPVSVVCPTCPVLLRCYTVEDWLDYFLPGWGASL